MPHLIVSCDEKWPIYDLEVPEEGQIANCEVPEAFYREYLCLMIKYVKFQKILEQYYDDYERKNVSERSAMRFPEGSGCVQQHKFNKIRTEAS